MLALGMIAALAMPGTAQAMPQLGDLGVKQSMSVKASNGESLEGKDLRAIQLATYTAASVDGNTIVGYDLTTNTALASDITAAAKAAGATDTNLTVNGKNDATSATASPNKPTSPSRMERRFPHSAKTKPPCRPATYSYRESTPSWTVHRRQPH